MRYPSTFFYEEKTSEIDYTSTPSGRFDVNRMLAGDPRCYIKNTQKTIQKKKKILIADWAMRGVNNGYRSLEEIKKALKKLLEDGFELFLWQMNEMKKSIVPLTLENLNLIEKQRIRLSIRSSPEQEMIEVMEEMHGVSRDNIIVLDPGRLKDVSDLQHDESELLIKKLDSDERTLYFSDLLAIARRPKIDKLPGIYKKYHSKLTSIIHDIEDPVYSKKILALLKPQFEYIEIKKEKINTIEVNDLNDLEKILADRQIDISNETTAKDKLKSLHGLMVKHSFILQQDGTEYLNHLLKQTDQLINLDLALRFDSPLGFNLLMKNVSLMTLKKFRLNNSITVTITDEELGRLNPHGLETIELNGVHLNIKKDHHFNALETLMLENAQLSMSGLLKILNNSPKLEYLLITQEESEILMDASLKQKTMPLNNLSEIALDCSISSDNLDLILRSAKSLVVLKLTGKIANEITEPIILDELKKLRIDYSKSNPITFSNIINHAKKLTYLMISSLVNNKSEAEYFEDLLENDHIAELTIDTTHDIDEEKFLRFLNKLHKLKNITFTKHHEFKNPKLIEKLQSIKKYGMSDQSSDKDKPTLDADAASLSEPKDALHNAAEKLKYKPTPKDFKFTFTNKNKSKDQGMVSEKFCQYLILKNKHTDRLYKIEDGMCLALSEIFLKNDLDRWNKFIDDILRWDGETKTLNSDLETHFEILLQYYIENHITHIRKTDVFFIGHSLQTHLKEMLPQEKIILSNPWHAICIEKTNMNQWVVYDPNYRTGYKTIHTIDEVRKTIHQSIGTLISIINTRSTTKPEINDPSDFFHQGGLHVLSKIKNIDEIFQLLPKDTNDIQLQDHGLQTILIRNHHAEPAWYTCLKSRDLRVRSYAIHFLLQFKNHYEDAGERLNASLSELTPDEKHNALALLRDVKFGISPRETMIETGDQAPDIDQGMIADSRNMADELSAAIQAELIEERKSTFKAHLTTWQRAADPNTSIKKLIQGLLQPDAKNNILVEATSSAAVNAFNLMTEQHCVKTRHPVFYIHSPEDLVCLAPRIIRKDDGTGDVLTGAGGALYDFIQANQHQSDPRPILIVNYDQFNADDIVRLNSLLDKNRQVDGVSLGSDIKIIGVIHPNKPNCYQGADFYSRFNEVADCPFDAETLNQKINTLPLTTVKPEETAAIDFYHASNWQERLLGGWMLNAGKLFFKEGALISALRKKLPIELSNAPWQDEKFNFFWQQTVARGYVDIQGERIALPLDLKIIREESYNFDRLKQQAVVYDSLSTEATEVLNPASLSDFFHRYIHYNDQVISRAGIIKEYHDQSLHVNLTHSLSKDEIAEILSACQAHNVTIHFHCAEGAVFPHEFDDVKHEAHPLIIKAREHTQFHSSHLLHQLRKDEKGAMVIDVSECEAGNLLASLQGHFDPTLATFQFTQTESVLMNALKNGRTVILTGRFSAELANKLAPLLLARMQQDSPSGKLILAADDLKMFSYGHSYTAPQPAAESFERLEARRIHHLAFPEHDIHSDKAWEGLDKAPDIKLNAFNQNKTADIAHQFTEDRLNSVNRLLMHAPYVYLTGLTAVGKTSFINEELAKDQNTVIFHGENKILDWAKDESNKRKILFIDEANITSREWSEFEGLYNNPPSILINGEYIELTENHKVIFAGNPLSYGGERRLSPFIEKHGNALLFHPMPLEFIYEKILKPALHDWHDQAKLEASMVFLNVYQFLCEHSEKEILITPRELQMMAILTSEFCKKHKNIDLQAVAAHYAYLLAKELVPNDLKQAFDEQFKPHTSLPQKETEKKDLKGKGEAETETSDFLITASREILSQHLTDLLNVREERIQSIHPVVRYGGLGGLVIEGEPGIGKSEIVTQSLVKAGYEEIHWPHPHETDKPFYRMPVSMQLDDKKALLLQAFHQGAVVLIDEINSSPMMERFLNDLLMGRAPDGSRPDKPGFMIIGTQNPASMGGRQKATTALVHRLTQFVLPPYQRNEMLDIIMTKGVPEVEANALVLAYEEQRHYAITNHLKPIPSFRDLLRVVDDLTPEVEMTAAKTSPNLRTSSMFRKHPSAFPAAPPVSPIRKKSH